MHVDHIIAGLQLGKIAEEAGGANFAAGAFNGGCDVEKVGMAEKGKAGVRKRDPFRERGADQQHPRGFLRALGSEAGGSIFRFAKHIGHFILAADIREALDLSGACGGQENGSGGSELGLYVSHTGNNVAVKTSTGPRGKLELRRGTDSERESLDVNLGSFFKRCRQFRFRPEVVRGGGGAGVTVALVIIRRGREVLRRSFAQSLRLIEEYDRPERTFSQLKQP